jgi:putative ABC transport system substrate-binding protein
MTEVPCRKSEVSIAVASVVFTLGVFVLGMCIVQAQERDRPQKIGYLITSSPAGFAGRTDAFLQALGDLGYQKGKNLVFESRYADGDIKRLSSLAADLVRLRVDIIVAGDNRAARAAREASPTIPIVMVSGRDPVESGLVGSLARPSENVTGVANLSADLLGKRVDLLKETIPRIGRVSVLLDSAPMGGGATVAALKQMQESAVRSGVMLRSLEVKSPSPDFEHAFRELAKIRAQALVVSPQPALAVHRRRILELALRDRMPTMTSGHEWVEAGALISYGVIPEELFRRAAIYVNKVLKGAKPADLPVEQPTKFELVINLKTAKQIGLTIPPNVLARADRVIR